MEKQHIQFSSLARHDNLLLPSEISEPRSKLQQKSCQLPFQLCFQILFFIFFWQCQVREQYAAGD